MTIYSPYPHCGDMRIPVMSSLGIGPRGHDISVETVEGENSYRLQFKDSVTGEVLNTTPNLDIGSRLYVCNQRFTHTAAYSTYSANVSTFSNADSSTVGDISTNDVVIFEATTTPGGDTDVLGVGVITSVVNNIVSFESNIEMNTGLVISSKVNDWLIEHPEATTTVADGSITEQKLSPSLRHITNVSNQEIILHPLGSQYGLDINSAPSNGIMVIANSTLITWSSSLDVMTTTYTISDENTVFGEVVVSASIADTDYTLNDTHVNASITAGVGVSVSLTSDGVLYVQSLMQSNNVTTGSLVVEWPHVVMGIAELTFAGQQEIGGIGRIVKIRNANWNNSQKTETFFEAQNESTGAGLLIGVGTGGQNRGLWDTKDNDWIIYRNKDGKTIINGPNFAVSPGGWVSGGPRITSYGNARVSLAASTSEESRNRGLWDNETNWWIIYNDSNDNTIIPGFSWNFYVSSHNIFTEQSFDAAEQKTGNLTITRTGWYPIGIVGWSTNTRYAMITRCRIDTATSGGGKIDYAIWNDSQSTRSVTATAYVMWARSK